MSRIIIFAEAYSSKNSRQIFKLKDALGKTRTIVAKSDNAKKQETDYHWQLTDVSRKKKWLEMTGNLEYPFRINFHFVRKTKRRFDYINLIQNFLDSMVKAGYIPDDDADHVIPIFHPYAIDKENPRIEFWVNNTAQIIPDYIKEQKDPYKGLAIDSLTVDEASNFNFKHQ